MKLGDLSLRALAWDAAIRPLDAWARQLLGIINGGLRLDEHLAGQVKRDVRYIGASTLTIDTSSKTRPLAVFCLTARAALTDDATTISSTGVLWTFDDGALTITGIDGLGSGDDYLVNLWIVEG